MCIVIDERRPNSTTPWSRKVRHVQRVPDQVVKRVLVLGDICIRNEDDQDVCIIERKSAQDLIASIKDSRYEEQSHRLIHASNVKPHNIVYIIENTLDGNCKPCEKMFYSAIVSLCSKGLA
jgi:ERCC4-type nuclease